MMNWETYLAIVLIALIIIMGISIIFARREIGRTEQAFEFLKEKGRQCAQAGTYDKISVDLAKRIVRRLFLIPPHHFADATSANRFWWDSYTVLLEAVLSLSSDPNNRVYLAYGSFEESRHFSRRSLYRQMLWVEFSYAGEKWVLWTEGKETPLHTESVLKLHTYRMFGNFGKLRTHEIYPASDIVKAYKEETANG